LAMTKLRNAHDSTLPKADGRSNLVPAASAVCALNHITELLTDKLTGIPSPGGPICRQPIGLTGALHDCAAWHAFAPHEQGNPDQAFVTGERELRLGAVFHHVEREMMLSMGINI
jgi:hypothetical protein